MKFRWPVQFRPEPEPDRSATDKLLEMMTWLGGLAAGGHQQVPISHAQDMLDPRHKMHDHPADPRADPVTGCLPVTADPPP